MYWRDWLFSPPRFKGQRPGQWLAFAMFDQ